MSKYLWITIIVFTLILIKVSNNPKDLLALEQNSQTTQKNEPNDSNCPNQIDLNTNQFPLADPNSKNIDLEDPDNIAKDPNNIQTKPAKKENSTNKTESAAKNSDETSKPKKQTKLSPVQLELYKEFNSIFSEYVNAQGNVNYSKLRRLRLVLKPATGVIENLKPEEYKKWSKEDKIAFWINTYNFHKIKAIIENYPIEGSRWLNPIWGSNSVRHIKNNIDAYKFIVMNEEFTFGEVESRFFKKQFKEPKVFFAITMGTKSSPAMLDTPYQGEKLYKQLENQVKTFLANEEIGFKADEQKGVVYLSLILKQGWYGSQFTEKYSTDKMFKDKSSTNTRAVLNFIINYIPQNNVSFLKIGNYSVEYLSYNWLLNE